MIEERIGQQFGNYQLTTLLGQGGFAKVYLGQHLTLPLKVAIKILSTDVDDDAQQCFQREAQTIAELQHPHIVRVLDYDVQHGTPFLVMDYASGGSLSRRYPRGSRLSLTLVATYTQQVAQALQYAHDHRFIHRDVKPENMLLGNRDEVLLSDFGIAMMRHTASHNKQNVAGTISYMAPEQLKGQSCAQSDQYALGVTVFGWLCGILPFHGSPTEIGMQHMLTSPPALSQYVPDISHEVEQVVLTALEKEPERRFASVAAFATALETAIHSSAFAFSGLRTSVSPDATTILSQSSSSFASQKTRTQTNDETRPGGAKAPRMSPPSSTNTEQNYQELRRRLENKGNPHMGILLVLANADQQGVTLHLVEQTFWNLSPDAMEHFPGTKHAVVRAYDLDQGRSVFAAVFPDLLPTQYTVWKQNRQHFATVVVTKGDAGMLIF